MVLRTKACTIVGYRLHFVKRGSSWKQALWSYGLPFEKGGIPNFLGYPTIEVLSLVEVGTFELLMR